jgi:hypothetical protein
MGSHIKATQSDTLLPVAIQPVASKLELQKRAKTSILLLQFLFNIPAALLLTIIVEHEIAHDIC